MKKSEIEEFILELSKCYDGEKGSLDFTSPFELLVAVMLSAQCTDARVNIVTKDLFKVANTPQQFAKMDIKEIEKLISSISFYRNKAKHIKECSIQIIEKYNGKVLVQEAICSSDILLDAISVFHKSDKIKSGSKSIIQNKNYQNEWDFGSDVISKYSLNSVKNTNLKKIKDICFENY